MRRFLPPQIRALLARRAAYREVFATPAGQLVLADLARFCGANTELMGPTSDVTAFNVGKHRVLQRITSFLVIDDRRVIELAQQQQEQATDAA